MVSDISKARRLDVMAAGRPVAVHVLGHVRVPMRDGVELDADVYRPESDADLPVVLMRLPYGKRVWQGQGVPTPEKVAAAGYIVVVQDVRGRFESGGLFDSPRQELLDGYDSVQWAAALPGSTGRVAMYGPSYLAHVQWAAALEHPPALTSILPMVSPNDSVLDGYFVRGGALELGSRISWAVEAIAPDELARRPGIELSVAEEIVAERKRQLMSCELAATRPLRLLADDSTFLGTAVQEWGYSWEELAAMPAMTRGRYAELDLPVFLIGGWFDGFLGSTLAQYEGLHAAGVAHPLHLVVGPWSHMGAGATAGDADFGPSASHAHMGEDLPLEDQHIRWFEATLLGRDEVLAEVPPVRLFVMGENRWASFEAFPPRAAPVDLYPTSDGSLARAPEPNATAVSYTYDPRTPAPTIGGATLLADRPPGPIDQRPLYDRDDIVSFVSEPLGEQLTVIGYVEATLVASSDAPDTDFVMRLCDVLPDGRALPVADGIIRASARNLYDHTGWTGEIAPAQRLNGEPVEYRFNLWATAYAFQPNHRIRLDITSSSFPRWDPNPNTGRGAWDAADYRSAIQSIHVGGPAASRIRLPTVSITTHNTSE